MEMLGSWKPFAEAICRGSGVVVLQGMRAVSFRDEVSQAQQRALLLELMVGWLQY